MKKIVIASVLKPANDVRSWDRIGKTLWQNTPSSIYLVGNGLTRNIDTDHRLHFHPYNRPIKGIVGRIQAQIQLWHFLEKVKPALLLITTPELLPISILYKWIYKGRLVYDVQEDYEKNIRHQRIHTGFKGKIVLLLARVTSKLAGKYLDHFVLAEACYSNLSFVQNKYTICENRFAPTLAITPKPQLNYDKIKLAFTGIISGYSGYKRALNLYRQLKDLRPDTELHIAGFTYFTQIRIELENLATSDKQIKLYGINEFLDHNKLIDILCQCNLSVVCHKHNEVSKDRIPTKLYEYLYLGIPFVIDKDSKWYQQFEDSPLTIPTNIDKPDPQSILQMLNRFEKNRDYSQRKDSSWDTQGTKLTQSITTLLSK